MKKAAIYVIILVVVSLTAGVILGMGIGKKGPCAMEFKRRVSMLDKISQRLELNTEQKEKVKEILDNARLEVQEAKKASFAKFAAIKEKTNAKIESILDAKQKAEFEKMIAELKDRFEKRKGFGRKHHPGEGDPGWHRR